MSDRVELLCAALVAAKIDHLVVDDDCWMSCPKSGQCCNDTIPQNLCNCGADAHNARIDAALAAARRPDA